MSSFFKKGSVDLGYYLINTVERIVSPNDVSSIDFAVTEEEKVDIDRSKLSTTQQKVYDQQYLELLNNDIFPLGEKLFAGKEEDVRTVCSLILAMQVELDPKSIEHVFTTLVKLLAASNEQAVLVRLKLLSTAFNSLADQSPLRPFALETLLTYAVATKQEVQLLRVLPTIETILTKMTLTPSAKAALYHQLYRISLAGKDSHAFGRKFVAVFDDAQVLQSEGAKYLDAIAQLVLSAITTGTGFDSLTASPVVKLLANSQQGTHAQVGALLSVFAKGGVSDLSAWEEKNGGGGDEKTNGKAYGNVGLVNEDVRRRFRAIVLSGMGREEPYSFDELRKALELGEGPEAVEEVAVQAQVMGCANVIIDEEAATVRVATMVPRKFGKEEWAELSDKLKTWTGRVDRMLNSLLGVVDDPED